MASAQDDNAETGESKPQNAVPQPDQIPAGWRELMGTDLIMKTIKEAPPDAPSVQPQDAVVIDFVGRAASEDIDANDGPVFQRESDWTIIVSEKDVLPCLEMCVRFMNVGETALVWSRPKYAYGPGQRKGEDGYTLPPNASVCYSVTVKKITPERSNAADQVAMARMKKVIGNDIYTNECFEDGQGKLRAQQQYKRGAETMQYLLQTAKKEDEDVTDAILEEAQLVYLDCWNNIAALHLRHKEYKKAKEAAVKALTVDPNNFKALIRAAKASLLDPGSSYEEVEAAIQAAAERSDSATQSDLNKLRAEFKRRKQAYKEKSKQMFSKIGNSTEKPKSKSADEENEKSKPSDTNDVGDAKENAADSAPHLDPPSSTAASTTGRKTSVKNWREWPWKNIILPYAFQLTLPFLMYWYFTILKKREHEYVLQQTTETGAAAQAGNHDEF